MATETSWRIRGDALEACSCDYGCPCQFGADPSKGFCEGVVGLHIQDGNYGNTRLSGLNLVLILRSPGACPINPPSCGVGKAVSS